MKIFVTGDTHKKINKVKEVYSKLRDVDLVVHLGDYVSDAVRLQKELEVDVLSVKGNCDGSTSPEDYKILETEYGKILVIHGHADHVKHSPLSLKYRAQELGCKAVLFGHTHCPFYDEYDGIYLINPGSLSAPRDGTAGSYAMITTTKDQFSAAIVYYSSIFPKKKPPEGGSLRNMLNYSDRF